MKRPLGVAAVILAAFCFAGLWSGLISAPRVREEKMIRCRGQVINKELKESYGSYYWQITLGKLSIEGKEEEGLKRLEKGRLLCMLRSGEREPQIGSRLTIEGKLKPWEKATNPGQFDFGQWHLSKGIYAQLGQAGIVEYRKPGSLLSEELWQLRQKAFRRLESCLGEKEGALVGAMILGEKSARLKESKTLYQQNGISHLLAISGLHLTLLGMGLYHTLKKLSMPTRAAAPISMMAMAVYCYFTGNSISACRATWMFCILLLAKMLGRSYDSLSALGLAAIVQLISNPYVLWDSGFQLSYLAVVGVSAVVPRLNHLFLPQRKIIKALLVSTGVGLVTLPVLLSHFGTYPWHSIFLNLLVVPLMAFLLWAALLLLGVTAIFSMESLVATPLILLIKGILSYYEACCELFEKLPVWEGYQGRPLLVCIILFYVGILIILWAPHRQSPFLCFLSLMACVQLLSLKPNGGMEITMLDVGQGDCIVIRSDSGHIYLSDCGSSSVSQVGTYRLLPFLRTKGYGRIEGIFISHLDQDHYNGIMELLEVAEQEQFSVEKLFLPDSIRLCEEEEIQEKLTELLGLAEATDVSIYYLQAGNRVVDKRMTINCLHPGEGREGDYYESNNGSLVLSVEYGEFSLLLTGDVEKEGEKEIGNKIDQVRQYSLLKVAHHGSAGSSSREFLGKIRPLVSLISCGKNNTYGHPAKETLERLAEEGSLILQTPETGAITIRPKRDGSFRLVTFVTGSHFRL